MAGVITVRPGLLWSIGLFCVASVQLFFLGILGEYVGAIYTQVRDRPLIVEQERINFDDGAEADADDARARATPHRRTSTSVSIARVTERATRCAACSIATDRSVSVVSTSTS